MDLRAPARCMGPVGPHRGTELGAYVCESVFHCLCLFQVRVRVCQVCPPCSVSISGSHRISTPIFSFD